jgi:hypothetical protein
MISGILRLVGAVCMLVFGTVFLPFLRGGMGPGGWPFSGRWGMEIPFLGGLFSVVVFLGMLGTALGIYTLWVMLPEQSGAEYERLVRGGGQMNSAAVSS